MDLTIDQGSFSRALAVAARIAPTSTPLPILQTVLLSAEPGQLTVSACNPDIALRVTLAASVTTPGAVASAARLLAGCVAELPAGVVRLTQSAGGNRVTIRCARSTAHFATLDPADFPLLPAPPASRIDFDAAALGRALRRVLPAVARDYTALPALTAVSFRFDDTGLTLAACDGIRLARVRATPESGAFAEHQELLIPQRGASELARLLSEAGSGETVRLALAAGQRGVWLAYANVELQVNIMDGTFPALDPLIPDRWVTRVTVDAGVLRAALRLGVTFGDQEVRPILLEAAGQRLRVLTTESAAGHAEAVLAGVTVEGVANAIMLDAPLVSALLDPIAPSTRLTLSWTNADEALTIREPGAGHETDCWLVMPVQLDRQLYQRAGATRNEAPMGTLGDAALAGAPVDHAGG